MGARGADREMEPWPDRPQTAEGLVQSPTADLAQGSVRGYLVQYPPCLTDEDEGEHLRGERIGNALFPVQVFRSGLSRGVLVLPATAFLPSPSTRDTTQPFRLRLHLQPPSKEPIPLLVTLP